MGKGIRYLVSFFNVVKKISSKYVAYMLKSIHYSKVIK
mgnify:FL=1